jgi:hypothetical protein
VIKIWHVGVLAGDMSVPYACHVRFCMQDFFFPSRCRLSFCAIRMFEPGVLVALGRLL